MDFMTRLLAVASAALLMVGFESADFSVGRQPSPTSTTQVAAGVSSFSPAATTTTVAPTTTTVAPTTTKYTRWAEPKCGQWWDLALEVGFPEEALPELDYIMWRESRCTPKAHNTTLNVDGSTDIGLMQINDRSWCLPTRWHPMGYLQTIGVLSNVGCEQLFDPRTNLMAAKALYDYSRQRGYEPFKQWGV